MKKLLSFLLALVMVLGMLPVSVQARMADFGTQEIGDHVIQEEESNDYRMVANPIFQDSTVHGSLGVHDPYDYFVFTLDTASRVNIPLVCDLNSMGYGIFGEEETMLLAEGWFEMEDGESKHFSLDTTLPAGQYYLILMDTNANHNRYTFYVDITPGDGGDGHVHSYTGTEVPPTCTAEGYTDYVCPCGDSYQDNFLPPSGHLFFLNSCILCGEPRPVETLPVETLPEEAPGIVEGVCGMGTTYRLTPEGVLTISAEGAASVNNHDWVDLPYAITRAVVEPGVTDLGASFFEGLRTLVSVELPDTLIFIGEKAFFNCTALTEISLPKGLQSLTYGCFRNCSALKEITLPGSISMVGNDVFYDCTGLETVTLEEGITLIGTGAFKGCTSLKTLNLPSTIAMVATENFGYECPLETVVYNGTPGDWSGVTVALGNDAISSAAFQFQQEEHTHSYTETVVPGNCIKDGYTQYVCDCGDAYHDNVIPATGHSWDDGVIMKEPTETEEGIECFSCTACGAERLEPVGVVEHAHSYTETVIAPTCTTGGYTVYSCACGEGYTDNETPATGHSFSHGSCIACGAEDPDYTGNPFDDVHQTDYFYKPVLWAVWNDITSGMGASEFCPNVICNRAQVVTFLWRANGKPEPSSHTNPFEDVKPSDWFFKAVLWAVEQGITSGMSPTKFGPHSPCTRAQVATFLWRSKNQPEPEQSSTAFTDVKPSDWFFKAVVWAVENGVTNGLDATTFGSSQNCTRGQVVTFLYRADSVPAAPEPPEPPATEPTEPTEPPTEPTEPPTEPKPGIPEDVKRYSAYPAVPDLGAWAGAELFMEVDYTYYYWSSDVSAQKLLGYYAMLIQGGFEYQSRTETADNNSRSYLHPEEDLTVTVGTRRDAVLGWLAFVQITGGEPVVPPTEPDEPDQPTEPPRELTRDDIRMKLRIPTNGYLNYYAEVHVENHTDLPLTMPSMFSLNGKLVNLYQDYVLNGGYQADLAYYRAMIPDQRWDDEWEDLYLDNNSLGRVVIEWNSDQYYIEFGVNGIVTFYRGNVNGPATDPVGPDQPTQPEKPDDPEQPDSAFYANSPVVPDLGVTADAELLMHDGGNSYHYSRLDVTDAEMTRYKQQLVAAGFVFEKTHNGGLIIDYDYDLYRHSTMDITVEVGFWKDSPAGSIAMVTIEGTDANRSPDQVGGDVETIIPDEVEALMTFTGSGDDVITGINLPAGQYFVEYNNTVDQHFAIWFHYSDSGKSLLANTIDRCSGTAYLTESAGKAVQNGYMEVSASGPWTIRIKPVSGTATTNIKGTGSIVTGTFTATNSRGTFSMKNTSDSNFIVWLVKYGSGPYDRALLVNDRKGYSGTVVETLEVGAKYFFAVTAEGDWTIDLCEGADQTVYSQPSFGGDTGGNPGGSGTTPSGDGYGACPSVPDFGVFTGVEPWLVDESADRADYSYSADEVKATAGYDALKNYQRLLQTRGFALWDNNLNMIVYRNSALNLYVTIHIAEISTGEHYTISISGDGFPA